MKPSLDPLTPPTDSRNRDVIDFRAARKKRAQGRPAAETTSVPPASAGARTQQNVFALLLVALLVAGGAWLIVQLRDSLKAELCVEAGHRNCTPVDPPK